MSIRKFHIIGGGIAGLTAAKYIKNFSPQAEVILYEASGKLGGRCHSYYDSKLDATVDNASHAILPCNKEARKITGKLDFKNSVWFYNLKNGTGSYNFVRCWKEVFLALFNLPLRLTARGIIKTTLLQMFPFFRCSKVYFTENMTSEKIINQHFQYIDHICFYYALKAVLGKRGRATKLIFNKEIVSLGKTDQVICAIDVHNFSRIFHSPEPAHNSIIAIHYRTSTPISLPHGKRFMAVRNGISQWIVVNGNILSVTISHADEKHYSKDELARKVWKEICRIRKVKAAFIPPYRVLFYPQATIHQDEINNALRPKSCLTKYNNFFLAGDWTMRDWPCSIEAAAQSGKRAAQAAKS